MKKERAFPLFIDDTEVYRGMTLRDYFAAKSLSSIINGWYADGLKVTDDDNADGVAMVAYEIADAMMEARK
jgi:hypothetical protein